jgi:cell division protease FtsH
MMGAERKSMVMTEEEKKATAYHESGHALVSLHVDGCDPLHKVTIIPRGRALGVTWNLPERDRYSMSMKQMKARLALCFGGRIAEQLIYGADSLNTGASNDIQQATDMARSMVMEYGMSEKLGWLRYRDNQEEVFLGHSVARSQSVSEETARLIDQEVRRLIEEAEGAARQVLTDNLDELHRLATALLEYETLTGEEAKRAIRGDDIGRDNQADQPAGQRRLDPLDPPPARRHRRPGAGGGLGTTVTRLSSPAVTPAEAGVSWRQAETSRPELPAFAGMTVLGRVFDPYSNAPSTTSSRKKMIAAISANQSSMTVRHRALNRDRL